MKLSFPVEEAINVQMKNEFFSAQLYRNMQIWSAARGYVGMEKFFAKRVAEETAHGDKWMKLLLENDNNAYMAEIEAPKREWDSAFEMFQYASSHEKFVTAEIHKIYGMVFEDKNHQALKTLQWFANEQVEEENMFETLLLRLGYASDSAAAVLEMDREIGNHA